MGLLRSPACRFRVQTAPWALPWKPALTLRFSKPGAQSRGHATAPAGEAMFLLQILRVLVRLVAHAAAKAFLDVCRSSRLMERRHQGHMQHLAWHPPCCKPGMTALASPCGVDARPGNPESPAGVALAN